MLTRPQPAAAAPAPDPAPQDELARLRAAEAQRDEIDSITRHDLTAPLNLILQASDLLLATDAALTADQQKRIHTIHKAGKRMLDMLNLAHALHQIEAHHHPLQPEPVDLLAVLQDVAERLRVLIRAQDSACTVLLNNAPPPAGATLTIAGERLLIHAILANLLKNALEATPRGVPVTVRLRAGAPVQIAIANRGAVPESIRARFFQRYIACNKPHSAGLGTYFARLCTEAHGGTISLDASQPGATTIHVSLPAAR